MRNLSLYSSFATKMRKEEKKKENNKRKQQSKDHRRWYRKPVSTTQPQKKKKITSFLDVNRKKKRELKTNRKISLPPSEKKKKEKYANAEQLNNSKYNYEKVTETPTAEARSQEIWWTLLQYASTLRIYSALFFFTTRWKEGNCDGKGGRGKMVSNRKSHRDMNLATHLRTSNAAFSDLFFFFFESAEVDKL